MCVCLWSTDMRPLPIWLDSELGVSSTFTLTMTLAFSAPRVTGLMADSTTLISMRVWKVTGAESLIQIIVKHHRKMCQHTLPLPLAGHYIVVLGSDTWLQSNAMAGGQP